MEVECTGSDTAPSLCPGRPATTFYCSERRRHGSGSTSTSPYWTPGHVRRGGFGPSVGFSISDPGSQHSIVVRNCTIKNSDWGISILYNNGRGSLSDVEIAGNTVTSDAIYTNGDGIHVAGRVSGIRIHDNRIENRGDAGIGLTSELPDTRGSGGICSCRVRESWNNVLTNDLVGLG